MFYSHIREQDISRTIAKLKSRQTFMFFEFLDICGVTICMFFLSFPRCSVASPRPTCRRQCRCQSPRVARLNWRRLHTGTIIDRCTHLVPSPHSTSTRGRIAHVCARSHRAGPLTRETTRRCAADNYARVDGACSWYEIARFDPRRCALRSRRRHCHRAALAMARAVAVADRCMRFDHIRSWIRRTIAFNLISPRARAFATRRPPWVRVIRDLCETNDVWGPSRQPPGSTRRGSLLGFRYVFCNASHRSAGNGCDKNGRPRASGGSLRADAQCPTTVATTF